MIFFHLPLMSSPSVPPFDVCVHALHSMYQIFGWRMCGNEWWRVTPSGQLRSLFWQQQSDLSRTSSQWWNTAAKQKESYEETAQTVRSNLGVAIFKNVYLSWIKSWNHHRLQPSQAAEDSLGASSAFLPARMCAVPLTLLHCRLLAINFDSCKLQQLPQWRVWTIQGSSTLLCWWF